MSVDAAVPLLALVASGYYRGRQDHGTASTSRATAGPLPHRDGAGGDGLGDGGHRLRGQRGGAGPHPSAGADQHPGHLDHPVDDGRHRSRRRPDTHLRPGRIAGRAVAERDDGRDHRHADDGADHRRHGEGDGQRGSDLVDLGQLHVDDHAARCEPPAFIGPSTSTAPPSPPPASTSKPATHRTSPAARTRSSTRTSPSIPPPTGTATMAGAAPTSPGPVPPRPP